MVPDIARRNANLVKNNCLRWRTSAAR